MSKLRLKGTFEVYVDWLIQVIFWFKWGYLPREELLLTSNSNALHLNMDMVGGIKSIVSFNAISAPNPCYLVSKCIVVYFRLKMIRKFNGIWKSLKSPIEYVKWAYILLDARFQFEKEPLSTPTCTLFLRLGFIDKIERLWKLQDALSIVINSLKG